MKFHRIVFRRARCLIGLCTASFVIVQSIWAVEHTTSLPITSTISSPIESVPPPSVSLNSTFNYSPHIINKQQIGKRRIVFVHIGKTGGESIRQTLQVACKMRQNPQNQKACQKQFQHDSILTPLNALTIGTMHCDHTVPKLALERASSILVSMRNPIARVISWFRYLHPANCNKEVDPQSTACHVNLLLNKDKTTKKKKQWVQKFFECFDSLDQVGMALGPSAFNDTTKECSHLARKTIIGKASPTSGHMYYNYEYYWNETLAKHPTLELFVIRTENLWGDVESIQETLYQGSRDKKQFKNYQLVQQKNYTHFSESHTKKDPISKTALQNLCCALTREIQIYAKFILMARNLSQNAKHRALATLATQCGMKESDVTMLSISRAQVSAWKPIACPETIISTRG